MSRRDTYILAVLAAVIVIGGYWMLLLGPKRKDLSKLDKQVADKQQELDKVKAASSSAIQDSLDFKTSYATLAKLGKAVPTEGSVDDDVPSLLLQVNHGADVTRTGFESFSPENDSSGGDSSSASSSGSSSSSTSSSGSGTPTASGPGDGSGASRSSGQEGGSAGQLKGVGYQYTFTGSFFDLENMIHYLTHLVRANNDRMQISGRLIAVESISFSTGETSGVSSAGASSTGGLSAEISVKSYMVPADQGLLSTPGTQAPDAGTTEQASTGSSGSSKPSAVIVRRP